METLKAAWMDFINAEAALTRVEVAGAARKVRATSREWPTLTRYWWEALGDTDREEYRKLALAGLLLLGTVLVRLLDLAARRSRREAADG